LDDENKYRCLVSVADTRNPSGESHQNLDPQIRRLIVPALKAGGRYTVRVELKMGRTVSRACLSTYAKGEASKGAPKEAFAKGSKPTGSAGSAEGTRQSEQSSGWAQASPACSQADETSSQAQYSTASTPTVAHMRRARQAKNLERLRATDVIFRAT